MARWWMAVGLAIAGSVTAAAATLDPGDAARGAFIASGGLAREGATACFRCHGLDGMGDTAAAVPRLAGLAAYYLGKQLRDFAAGTRPHGIMSPIANALERPDIASVALHYARMPVRERETAAPADSSPGAALYAEGDPDRGIEACATCHGAAGISPAPAIPSLAGQPASYLALQLRRWRSGQRHNDPLNGMTRFAERLTEAEVDSLAEFIANLPPTADGES